MTREEALKIIDQDNCFGCVDVGKYCDKCGMKKTREILWNTLNKLEAYENADLIEREVARKMIIEDIVMGEHPQRTKGKSDAGLIISTDVPRFNPKGDNNE